jgi:methylenetetrahydrofolate dehydrogenase (NADP+)/methenyltetrahydrofolate cyclohydrolase
MSSDHKKLLGAEIAKEIKAQVAAAVQTLRAKGVIPTLAAVIAAEDPATASYVKSKEKAAAALGINFLIEDLGAECTQAELEARLDALSDSDSVHGILLELPLHKGLDQGKAIEHIRPSKDVDGMTAYNRGLIAIGDERLALIPATPQACLELAERKTAIAGKRAAVVGRGATVGRPLLSLLVTRSATVTVCHTKTENLAAILKEQEIIFVAAGKAGLIGKEHVSPGQIVIDAGINIVDGKIAGDVRFDEVAEIVAWITPTPGGVGPLTSSIIFRNLIKAIKS